MCATDATDPAALFQAFCAGDEAAFQSVMRLHRAAMAQRIRDRMSRRLQRRVSVADVLQETELAAYRGRADTKAADLEALRPWLLAIAERQALMQVRHHAGTAKRAVGRELTRDRRPSTQAAVGRQPSPSQILSAEETRHMAVRAREALPADHQAVLRMALEDRVPLREVAARMGRSYEATRKLYGRAYLRFRQIFEELRERGT